MSSRVVHKHLPVFGIFNYIYQTTHYHGGHNTGTTSETNMHYKGIEFGRPQVWKQWNFLVLNTLYQVSSGHPNVCTRKGGDPPGVHAHYVLPSNTVATNDIHMWLLLNAAVDKLCLYV